MTNKTPNGEKLFQTEYQGLQPQRRISYEEDVIDLRELILVLIKGKKTIAIVTVVVMLLTMAGGTMIPNINIGTKGTVQTAVQLYFSGIELGQSPNGATYDVNEIKSTEVLKNAIDNIDFGRKQIPIEKLKNNITFQAVVPDSVAKTLDELEEIKDDEIRMERLDNLKAYSDTYIVKLNLDDSLGLDQEEGRALLDNIVLEYKMQLIDKYGGVEVLGNIFADDFNLSKYDYIQAANILNDQLSRMDSFVKNHMPQTGVQSTVTGLNPADITSALKSIRTVDMERIFANISAFYLTKDPDNVVAIYEQLVEDKQKAAAQYWEEATQIKTVIQNYKKDEQTVIMGQMSDVPLNLTSENEQYNKFVTQYIEASENVVNANEDAKYYHAEAEHFRVASGAAVGLNTQKAVETEKSIELLSEKLVYWTKEINDTAEDYNSEATYKQYTEQLMPSKSYAPLEEGIPLPMLLLIGVLAGLVLGVVIVLFRVYIKEEKEVA